MKRSLVVLALVLILNGVNSVDPKDEHEMDKVFVFGSQMFLNFLDNVKMNAESALKKNEFNRTGNELENLWKTLKELMEKTIAEQRAKGNQDDFLIATRIFQHLGIMFADGFFDVVNVFSRNHFISSVGLKGIIKNETIVKLWRDVGSQYFPDAPPVYTDPVGFLSYLLSKIVVKPQMVRNLKVASEVMKLDTDQLYKDALVAINQVREKAIEFSAIERQTEKNDFAVSLRTASAVLVFYWDKFVEYSESSPFHDKYIDSIRQWKELRMLKNISNSCHSEIDHQALNWAGQNFGNLFNHFGQEYYRWGDGIFGDQRFNQSNWAFLKMASVYRLPVYQKLCQSGFGMSEVNNLLKTANGVLMELGGEDFMHKSRDVIYELWTVFEKEILSQTEKLHTTSDVKDIKNPLQHLRTIKEILFDMWDDVLSVINSNIKEDEVQKSLRYWDEVKTIFIKVLTDSGELTQENLDGAQKTVISVGNMVLEKYVKMIDGLDKRISASIESLGKVTLQTFGATNNVLINILLFLLSD